MPGLFVAKMLRFHSHMHFSADGTPELTDAPAPRNSACGVKCLIPIDRMNASRERVKSSSFPYAASPATDVILILWPLNYSQLLQNFYFLAATREAPYYPILGLSGCYAVWYRRVERWYQPDALPTLGRSAQVVVLRRVGIRGRSLHSMDVTHVVLFVFALLNLPNKLRPGHDFMGEIVTELLVSSAVTFLGYGYS